MTLPASARPPLSAWLVAWAVAGSACVDIGAIDARRYVEHDERRFAVGGRPDVVVSTFDGSIEVRSWDRPEVLIEIEKRAATKDEAGDIEVRSEQDGNRVTVDVRVRSGAGRYGPIDSRGARLIVSIPAAADLQAASGDGSIHVVRVSGRIELRSGDGSIRGADLTGEIRAQTGDGSVSLEGIRGTLDIGTADGSIVASGQLTAVQARSGDGSVTVRAESGSAARADWRIATGDGSVVLELPEVFDADLDAHTADGRVSVRAGALSEIIESTRRTVRGKLGSGGRPVHVRSGDGSITLRRS